MTLDEQLAYFDRKAEQAFTRCLKDFRARRESIIVEARERIIAGFDMYGAEGFRWDYHRLRQAELEEYADGINYRLMRIYQGWPT